MEEFLKELSDLTKKHGIIISSEKNEINLIDFTTDAYLEFACTLNFDGDKYEIE